VTKIKERQDLTKYGEEYVEDDDFNERFAIKKPLFC
jgi:hypothetical protein